MKKRAVLREIQSLRADMVSLFAKRGLTVTALDTAVSRLTTRVNGLNDRADALDAGRAIDIRAKAKLLDDALARLGAANVDEMLKKLTWLHDRVDLLANKQDALNQRHDRVTYAVGQFDARLTRLEQPPRSLNTASQPDSPAKPHKRPPRKNNGPDVPAAPK